MKEVEGFTTDVAVYKGNGTRATKTVPLDLSHLKNL